MKNRKRIAQKIAAKKQARAGRPNKGAAYSTRLGAQRAAIRRERAGRSAWNYGSIWAEPTRVTDDGAPVDIIPGDRRAPLCEQLERALCDALLAESAADKYGPAHEILYGSRPIGVTDLRRQHPDEQPDDDAGRADTGDGPPARR